VEVTTRISPRSSGDRLGRGLGSRSTLLELRSADVVTGAAVEASSTSSSGLSGGAGLGGGATIAAVAPTDVRSSALLRDTSTSGNACDTVMEAARLVRMQLQSGKVRQHERGALHAMDPRLYMCAVPFVAREERGLSALIVSVTAMRNLTMYSSEGFTERLC
jgi:hypothetical protein